MYKIYKYSIFFNLSDSSAKISSNFILIDIQCKVPLRMKKIYLPERIRLKIRLSLLREQSPRLKKIWENAARV